MSGRVDVLRSFARDDGAFRVTKPQATALALACGDALEAVRAIEAVRDALYPNGDREQAWSPDTLDAVARIVARWEAKVTP